MSQVKVKERTPCLQQLIEEYNKTSSSVIGIQSVPEGEINRYGVINPGERNGRRVQVKNVVEKPSAGRAPADFAIMGRYVLTPEIFMF